MMNKVFIAGLMLCGWLFAGASFAAGPSKVASYDRSVWPEVIDTAVTFNRASYFENLVFLETLLSLPQSLDEEALKTFTGLKSVNPPSVKKWLDKTLARIRQNLVIAKAKAQITSEQGELLSLPSSYQAWVIQARQFYQTYLYEQVRLAALFPRITSEIDTFSPQELTGFELADSQFLLSFDDGPSSMDSERSEKILEWLNANGTHGAFFMLGEHLEARIRQQGASTVATLYQDQCIGSHGYQHNKHTKAEVWQDSLRKTDALIAQVSPNVSLPLFRPPYGQRSLDLVSAQTQRGRKLVFWNIDSQDWNRKLDAKAVTNRVTSLMLLWRRGIILFHDIHGKAVEALPQLNQLLVANQSTWQDCRAL
jgi:peptidoglycan/xylan/chitin deacetylase (PgdA/CDA1 family)